MTDSSNIAIFKMTINALQLVQDQPELQNQHVSVEIPHQTLSICKSQTPHCVVSEEPERVS